MSRSISTPSNSSTKKGLPSARSTTSSLSSVGRPPASISSSIRTQSCAESGSSSSSSPPARPVLEKLGPRRHDHEQRPLCPAQHVLEEVEELRLRPVNVLDQQNCGPLGDEVGQELGPG